MRISMPAPRASLSCFLSLAFFPPSVCEMEVLCVIFPDMIMYIHPAVCVRASNKIVWPRDTHTHMRVFEYAFWRFVYLFASHFPQQHPRILSICLPFTRARRMAEISDIVANKLIYYYFLRGIRNFSAVA